MRAVDALVSPGWLETRREDPQLRLVEIAGTGQEDSAAYRAGHVPGAASWWWKDALWDAQMRDFLSPQAFARRCAAEGIGNETTVVFYGEPVQFGIYAWWTFKYCGHERVCVLDGGRMRWAAEGRSLTTEAPPQRASARYTPVLRNEGMRIRRDELLSLLGTQSHVILDGRSPEEYRGERVNSPGKPDVGALRYGRIPGARHLYFEDLLRPDSSFKPVDEVRAVVQACRMRADQTAIAYCRMSHRATVLYFVLTEILGHEKARVYDGSWTEWGNLVEVPIER